MTNDEFHRVLDEHPEWAAELSAGAVRRSEEAELVDLLTSQFCLTDPVAIEVVRAATEWVKLEPGEILACEGDELDSVSVVIRGGLQATRWDEVESISLVVGHVGRGQVVGGIRLLGTAEPTPTITAVRASVLARIPAEVSPPSWTATPGWSSMPASRCETTAGALVAVRTMWSCWRWW